MEQNDESQPENILDDFQDIDLDINSLYNKFIVPIESIRSKNAPNVSAGVTAKPNDQLSSGVANNKEPQESRAHTFYRMLGLPVISDNGSFYNPGFNPKRTAQERKDQVAIASKVSVDVKQMQARREIDARQRISIFKNAGLEAAIFSAVLSIPNGQKIFKVMDDSQTDPLAKDLQIASVPAREFYLDSAYSLSDDSSPSDKIKTQTSHMLRPFVTDPVICTHLSPRTIEVCVPFPAKKEDTAIERSVYLKRCGLEFILRLRLRQKAVLDEQKTTFTFADIKKTLGNNGDLTLSSIAQIVAALQDSISPSSSDIDKALNNTLYIELYTLNDLVRALKGLINLYKDSLVSVYDVSQKIIWTPLCSTRGPEGGTQIVNGFIKPKTFLSTWSLEKRLIQLQIKASLAKKQQEIGTDINFSDFAISEYHNVSNIYDQEIKDAEQQRSRYESIASDAMKTIEIINGEVSGLGLVDILAVYMALWSLDLSVLLGLLDDSAAERLYNIKELRTSEVEDRYNNRTANDVENALLAFDSRVVSILSYADRLFDLSKGSPSDEESGDVTRNS